MASIAGIFSIATNHGNFECNSKLLLSSNAEDAKATAALKTYVN